MWEKARRQARPLRHPLAHGSLASLGASAGAAFRPVAPSRSWLRVRTSSSLSAIARRFPSMMRYRRRSLHRRQAMPIAANSTQPDRL